MACTFCTVGLVRLPVRSRHKYGPLICTPVFSKIPSATVASETASPAGLITSYNLVSLAARLSARMSSATC
ncbi:Uncharacterised protein [Mycobacteroides abscessus subsp. abscessus]|nr:Uncharacterised protein [Mycobacteroides abscessus subsp. abscessus]